jgi:transcriptional regulator with XRE-family HTH domain
MPRTHLEEYPNRIRFWRDHAKLTGEELGKRVGLSKTEISRLELGHRDTTFTKARLLAEALGIGISPADLMTLKDNPNGANPAMEPSE